MQENALAGFILRFSGLLPQIFVCVIVLKHRHRLGIPPRFLRNHQAHRFKVFVMSDLQPVMPREHFRLLEQHQPFPQFLGLFLLFFAVTIRHTCKGRHRQAFQDVVVLPRHHIVEQVREVQAQLIIYFFF